MKLYLISQSINNCYDTFDSAVVAAHDEEEARNTNPAGKFSDVRRGWIDPDMWDWCSSPEQVKVEYLGEDAHPDRGWRVICASYNAG